MSEEKPYYTEAPDEEIYFRMYHKKGSVQTNSKGEKNGN